MGIKNKIVDGYPYYLTLTVVDWIDLFSRPVYKRIIVDALRYCKREKGVDIYSWCLMTNHLHLIASIREGSTNSLSDFLRDFKKYTNKRLIEEIETGIESRQKWMLNQFEYAGRFDVKIKNYKLWQEGNEAKEIRTSKFMLQKINYIHMNPVRAEIVLEPDHYMYSSAIDYNGGKGLIDIVFV